METIKAWLQPGIMLAVVLQGVSGITLVNGIDNRATTTERDVTKMEGRLGALEKTGGDGTAKLAVVETQLGYVVESLKRIENRMEAASERKR